MCLRALKDEALAKKPVYAFAYFATNRLPDAQAGVAFGNAYPLSSL